jgi:hypothetical protein
MGVPLLACTLPRAYPSEDEAVAESMGAPGLPHSPLPPIAKPMPRDRRHLFILPGRQAPP